MSSAGLDFTWDSALIPALTAGLTTAEAVYRLKKNLPDFVWNTVAMEGNTFTFPEVQTILDGVTVGGHPISEIHQVQATAEAAAWLIDQVTAGAFTFDQPHSDHCNWLLARHEALAAGTFRTSSVGVALGERGTYRPPHAETLHAHFVAGMAALATVERIEERALAYFAFAARAQFYFDGNKRTARHMMNGLLMTYGFAPIVVPVARILEFHQACVVMFADADATPIMRFLATCST